MTQQKQTQFTSALSYAEVKTSGKEETQKQRCLNYLKQHSVTDGEAIHDLQIKDVNNYRPRRNELVKEGKVHAVTVNGKPYRRTCRQSGKLCIVWRATP